MIERLQPLNGLERTPASPMTPAGGTPAPATGFAEALGDALNTVNRQYAEADQAAADLATGRSRDVHGTMIAMEKADISFRLVMQVRNKIVSAYETIMRTQV